MAVSRGSGKDIAELHQYCMELVDGINVKYGDGDYAPVVWLERPVRKADPCTSAQGGMANGVSHAAVKATQGFHALVRRRAC